MKIITKYSSYILAFLLLSIFTQSCREEPLDITPIPRDEIMSYSDLFDNFWDEMNNNYNYFFEEDYDWDDVYEIYSPKFKKLRTFNDKNADPNVAEREIELAFKYFADIVSKIKDRHFNVLIIIPYRSKKEYNYNFSKVKYVFFQGGMKYKYSVEDGFEVIYDDSDNPMVNSYTVRKLMKDKLVSSTVFNKVDGDYELVSGYLKSDPSTMYINYSIFVNSALFDPLRKFPLLSVVDKYKMKEDAFDNFFKVDPDKAQYFKKKMMNNIEGLYKTILDIIGSSEYKEYLAAREHFFETEDISKLDAIKDKFENFITKAEKEGYINEKINIKKDYEEYISLNKKDINKRVLLNIIYHQAYNNALTNLLYESNLMETIENPNDDPFDDTDDYKEVSFGALIKESCDRYGEVYKKLFNPLTKGEVKKLIIDLRGNGGGDTMDTNFFVSRFIYKKSNAGYYRTKAGDGRFNYGPWLPFEIEPHKFSIPKAIPTVILLDRGSASMSEISSMLLKSQGDHVKIIGDNSAGATAALGPQDEFNGGSHVNRGYIHFYMPYMAYKTLEGKIIEEEGVTPDIKVIPTKEEVKNMKTTKYDRAFEKALEEIRKMTVN